MLSPSVLIAIAVCACAVVGAVVWLMRTPSGSTLRDYDRPNGVENLKSPERSPESPQASSLTLMDLVARVGVPEELLQGHSGNYREVRIPKNNGGTRRLEVPDEATRELQRKILKRLLAAVNAHPLACGFEEGASIVDAALPHEGKAVVLKMDIRRFFESTTSERVAAWFAGIGWDHDSAALLTDLTTYNGHLPQGAPTSPRLSNLVNAPLDQALLVVARKHGGHYSRYADDITMSFPRKRGRTLRGIVQVVRRILRSYGYAMHGGKKLRVLRQQQQQRVLGLVVNHRVALPRKTRRWIRAVRHQFDLGKPISITEQQLKGWESLAQMVETQREDG